MREVVRSRLLWAAFGSITLVVVLLITVAPARDVTHTVLGWLRVRPLEIRPDDASTAASASMAPPTPTPTLAEIVEVMSVEPSATIPEATTADIDDLPFEVVGIDPPPAFSGEATRSVTTFGTVTLQLDTAELARALAPGLPSRSLARRLGTDDVAIAGGALVLTRWPSEATGDDPLTLVQIEAPLVTGLPPRDLELLTELLAQAFVPPILSREFDVLEIPLVRLALGLEVEAEAQSPEPVLTELPTGDQAVTWTRGRSQFLLTGPLPPDGLLRLAETARTDR